MVLQELLGKIENELKLRNYSKKLLKATFVFIGLFSLYQED
jgi:hypothetical protein